MKPRTTMRKRITRAIAGAAIGAGIGIGITHGMSTHYQKQAQKAKTQVRQSYIEMPGSTPGQRLPTKEEIAKLRHNINKLNETHANAQKWENRSPKAGKIGLGAGGLIGFAMAGPKRRNRPQKRT